MCYITGYSHLHWEAAKRVLQYLQATKDIAIEYSHNAATVINSKLATPIGYCNADWAANKEDHKSISAYTFMLAGGPISWASKAQTTMAVSSTEAEYITLSEATHQAIYVNALHKDLKLDTTQPLVIYIDNQSAQRIATAPTYTYHARMKHLDVRLHHVHDAYAKGTINVLYCPTEHMIANLLTKGLPEPKLVYLKNEMGLRNKTINKDQE